MKAAAPGGVARPAATATTAVASVARTLEKALYIGITVWALYDVLTREAQVSAHWAEDAQVNSPKVRQDVRAYSGLEPAWLPGPVLGWAGSGWVDNKDGQLKQLHAHFRVIVACVAAWGLLKFVAARLLRRRCVGARGGGGSSGCGDGARGGSAVDAAFNQGVDLVLSFAVAVYLHELYVLALLAVIGASYVVSTRLFVGRLGGVGWAGVWAVNLALLLLTRFGPGAEDMLRWAAAHDVLAGVALATCRQVTAFRGEVAWTATVHFVVLRLIAFELDLHWALLRMREQRARESGGSSIGASAGVSPVAAPSPGAGQDRVRAAVGQAAATAAATGAEVAAVDAVEFESMESQPARATWLRLAAAPPPSMAEFSVLGLLAFSFYLPLFATGPMNSYNVYAHCRRRPRRPPLLLAGGRGLAAALARWLCLVAALEAFLHVWHPSAMMFNLLPTLRAPFFRCCDGLDLLYLCYVTVLFLWLKFSVVWSAARLWAAADGVVTVDNMPTFVNAVHTPSQFWRSWHASFHSWLVRYLYTPVVAPATAAVVHIADAGTTETRRPAGSRWSPWRRTVGTALVFAFVAVWHEASVQMAAWATVFGLVVSVDNACAGSQRRRNRDRPPQSRRRPHEWGAVTRRYAMAAVCAVSILVLMMGNIVAYGYKPDAGDDVLYTLMQATLVHNGVSVALALAFLFAATQAALLMRERPDDPGDAHGHHSCGRGLLKAVDRAAVLVTRIVLLAWPLMPLPEERGPPQPPPPQVGGRKAKPE